MAFGFVLTYQFLFSILYTVSFQLCLITFQGFILPVFAFRLSELLQQLLGGFFVVLVGEQPVNEGRVVWLRVRTVGDAPARQLSAELPLRRREQGLQLHLRLPQLRQDPQQVEVRFEQPLRSLVALHVLRKSAPAKQAARECLPKTWPSEAHSGFLIQNNLLF